MKTFGQGNSLTVLSVFWGRCPGRPLGMSLLFSLFWCVFHFFYCFVIAILAIVQRFIVAATKPTFQHVVVLLKTRMHTNKQGTVHDDNANAAYYESGSVDTTKKTNKATQYESWHH